jgi:hypothetical protein
MEEIQLFDDMDKKSRRLLKIYIKLGWKKLNDYYGKLTSTAYVAAVVFHLCKKWRALERLLEPSPFASDLRMEKDLWDKFNDDLGREV